MMTVASDAMICNCDDVIIKIMPGVVVGCGCGVVSGTGYEVRQNQ